MVQEIFVKMFSEELNIQQNKNNIQSQNLKQLLKTAAGGNGKYEQRFEAVALFTFHFTLDLFLQQSF